jgi:perosamine synthetase
MTNNHIPYGHHWIDEDDIQAVVDVLRSDWITQGEMVGLFERAIAEYCQAKYAVVVSSATAGLHIASITAGVKPRRNALTSPLTFVASANAALYCGAKPIFSDIDPDTYNICPYTLERSLQKGHWDEDIAAIIPVHFAGQCCDMELLYQIAKQHGISIIEDASHALGGALIDGKGKEYPIGSCSHSDMTVFSFHPVKHITTGEGGVVLTNDLGYYENLCELRNHGITKAQDRIDPNIGPWYYEMQSLGYNYRITDFQCALGISQLKKLNSWIKRRREIAQMYNRAFADLDEVKIPYQASYSNSAYHLYPIQIIKKNDRDARRKIFEELSRRGIGVQVHYIPVHMQPYYKEHMGYKDSDFPIAKAYYERALSLPIVPRMTDGDVERIVVEFKKILSGI